MKLNCDLGEGLADVDIQVMPYIDMASIACGGHVGDGLSMATTVDLAIANSVILGAHPSYPDRERFGRYSLEISEQELECSLTNQVSKLHSICLDKNAQLSYIKPHGALYHDLTTYPAIAQMLVDLANRFDCKLMVMASKRNEELFQNFVSVTNIIYEAFADRSYTDEGSLVPREFLHSVHATPEESREQAIQIQNGLVISEGGKPIPINAQSLCVHSDTPNAIKAIQLIRQAFKE